MKNNFMVLIVLTLLIASVGCSKEEIIETQSTETKKVEETTTSNTESITTDQVAEVAEEENKELTDIELIKTLDVKMPEALFIEAINKMEGITIQQKMYIRGEDYRVETKGENGNQVMVYNSKDGITYIYDDSMPTGTLLRDSDEEDDEEFEEIDISYGDELFEGIEDTLISAKKMVYNGYDVVYVVYNSSETGDNFEIRQWISTDFWYPIKAETLLNGTITSEYELVSISSKEAMDSKWYEKPEGIEFFDLDAMMNIPQP